MSRRLLVRVLLVTAAIALIAGDAAARNPYKRAFMNVYPSAAGSVLDNVPSNAGHCGACHFDFDGGGPRNPHGLDVEVALASGMYATTEDAIASTMGIDSDNDGYTNEVEITDTVNFSNTPTFPGLKASNVGNVVNVDQADLLDYLTPSGGSDTTPPLVTVLAPSGGESFDAGTTQTVSWDATDDSGISTIDVMMSDDGGTSWKPIAEGLADTGSWDWFVHNLPGASTVIRVQARDLAGNFGHGDGGSFTIVATPPGVVPTTLRDFELAGTQPLESGILEDPSANCVSCHGEYDYVVEPWHTWRGSMMAQAARDPLWMATMSVAEQDAPSVGDLCIRCHSPGGWQEGRSHDTTGAMLTAKDRQGVQCDYCHRMVDPHYETGVSPAADADILAALDEVPLTTANGQFITDPDPIRRGPYADALASHQFLESPFHREAALCGTCHDVSNPAFVQDGDPLTYAPDAFDAPHPDGDLRNMFPVERTYSEWSQSEYAATGVYAPLFAGTKPDGIVGKCQDCHMRDVAGKGAAGGPNRTDLPLHDMTGGNHFAIDLVDEWFPGESTLDELADGRTRALHQLSLAATMQLTPGQVDEHPTLTIRVQNETGHKLPSGYPEGRRIWLNVRAFDRNGILVYESGAYDAATGELGHDADAKIYHIEPGISTRLAGALGGTAGPSFHFVLNDTVYLDNRIPPRGFTNAAFMAVQSPPVGYTYADGQYWDETEYVLPSNAVDAEVVLYYQSTSKEYIEFLRDENVTDTYGQQLHDSWVNHGRAAPIAMVSDIVPLIITGVEDTPQRVTSLEQNHPNPFNPSTRIRYHVASSGHVKLDIFDAAGRLVRTLVDWQQPAGEHLAVWDGYDGSGRRAASGAYFYVLRADGKELRKKMTLIK